MTTPTVIPCPKCHAVTPCDCDTKPQRPPLTDYQRDEQREAARRLVEHLEELRRKEQTK